MDSNLISQLHKGFNKGKLFLALVQALTLKVLHMEKGVGEREAEREKEREIQNSRKSRPCCAKLLQLFLFLLAVSFGFTFSATAVHMSRKAYSMAKLHGGGGEDRARKAGAG